MTSLLSACTAAPANAPSYDIVPVDAAWGEGGAPMGAPWSESPAPTVQGAAVARGFFLRRYATVVSPRSMSLAPNGDVFVTSPARMAPGGEGGGPGAILVLSDDDRDGVAEIHTFAEGVADVHAVAVRNGYVYFTSDAALFRTPYAMGMRREANGMRERVFAYPANVDARWTHGVDVRADGTVITSRGVWGTSRECGPRPEAGEIYRVDSMTSSRVVQGLRNPLYIRCHRSNPLCIAAELGDDRGPTWGALEKLIAIEENTQDVGFPCCITQSRATPYNGGNVFDCSSVTAGVATFTLQLTPFGLDWEPGVWPGPFNNGIFVALHGSFYSNPRWEGASVVFATTDAAGKPTGAFMPFLLGFGPGGSPLERPADVLFSNDGRLFVADDRAGAVYWIAPDDLRRR